MQNQGNGGRTLDQKTHDGTSSAGTMGTGGTGRTGTDEGYDEAANTPWQGSMQTARTDDLLSDGSAADQDGQGYASDGTNTLGSESGSGAGNRQKDRNEDREQSLSGGGRPSDPTGLQGSAGNQQSSGDDQQG
ncbi:hypothetical protein [Pseudoduganella albidiflava]|uniref:Uncharacterized protein n=1 Tax=Pseudoduganella albidiflava TaxID=321983 RepID=A0A411X2D8_9BURK|nr:hypothetical protein [Pseudoduganella albidiflava]QBI03114.1 hypothetical protein EYF70_21465 [Pseudoduganella albidiflava]GGY69914.1 hypothetical protein GCM10007387_59850 [Pseudoduganella albidiflava]